MATQFQKLETVSDSGRVDSGRMRLATMTEPVSPAGVVLAPAPVCRRVRELLTGASDRRLALRLGVSRHCVLRVAAGQAVRAGSLALLLAALARLGPEGP